MLLSYNQLITLVDQGFLQNVDPDCINASSIDVRLGGTLLIERVRLPEDGKEDITLRRISLAKRDPIKTVEWDFERDGNYILYPGEFILGHTMEIFNLPDNVSALYRTKSSMARVGLDVLNAGWCDPGFHNSAFTLALKNEARHHEIVLTKGVRIGQIIFFEHDSVPAHKSYATVGTYNRMPTASSATPLEENFEDYIEIEEEDIAIGGTSLD